MNLKEHQAKIQKLPYKCFSLRSAEGKRLISANTELQPSKLPAIIAALEDMPPGNYVIRCSNNSKDGYDYPIVTQPTNAPATNVLTSQASADDLKTAERLGRLESENAFLRQQLAEAGERIQALEADALEALAEDPDEDDFLAEQPPSAKEQLLEAIAPVIPALADRALALVDKFLNKPSAQPLAEAPRPAAPVIDYERLANMVSQKLMEAQQYDDEPVS
jgi:hypothetical protein